MSNLVRCAIYILNFFFLVMSFHSQALEKKVETLDEVTIIGNTELPRVTFDQPWQLPSIEKSEERSPPKDLPGIMVPLEPHRYKQQLHFSHYLDVDIEVFQPK